MKMKVMSLCVFGMVLVSGVTSFRFSLVEPSGWGRYHNDVPCALAKWNGFPLIPWDDWHDWSQLLYSDQWPLVSYGNHDWENRPTGEDRSACNNVHSRECDPERQRLRQLYQESVERSKRAEEAAAIIKQRLDELKTRWTDEKPNQLGQDFRDQQQASGRYCKQRHVGPHLRHERAALDSENRRGNSEQRHTDSSDECLRSGEDRPTHSNPQPSDKSQYSRENAAIDDQPRQERGHPDNRHPRSSSHRQHVHDDASHPPRERQDRHTDPSRDRPNGQRQTIPQRPQPAHRQSYRASPSSQSHSTKRPHGGRQQRQQETLPKRVSEIEEVMLIPTRGFSPRDLRISHHGNHIRVHASRTCSSDETCVSREMETSYSLPFSIVKGSMKASVDGDDIVIKGRRDDTKVSISVTDKVDDSPLISEIYDSDKDSGLYDSFYGDGSDDEWTIDDGDLDDRV